MQKPPLPSHTLDHAQGLRASATDAEQRLWYHLRGGRLAGLKFRRQHPIPPYVVDFYCDAFKLIVEIDGSQHTVESDAARTRALRLYGYTVMRFWSHDALARTEAVLEAILAAAYAPTLTPTPLPVGEGL